MNFGGKARHITEDGLMLNARIVQEGEEDGEPLWGLRYYSQLGYEVVLSRWEEKALRIVRSEVEDDYWTAPAEDFFWNWWTENKETSMAKGFILIVKMRADRRLGVDVLPPARTGEQAESYDQRYAQTGLCFRTFCGYPVYFDPTLPLSFVEKKVIDYHAETNTVSPFTFTVLSPLPSIPEEEAKEEEEEIKRKLVF